MKAHEVEFNLQIGRKDGKPTFATITSNVKCSERLLIREGHATYRMRGTSMLTSICVIGDVIQILIGPGFFAGREPSTTQIKQRAAKAIWELVDSIDDEKLIVQLTVEKLAKCSLQELKDVLEQGAPEPSTSLAKNTKRVIGLNSNLIHLANALKGE